MEIKLRNREKIKAEALKINDAFRTIEKQNACLVVDFTIHDLFQTRENGNLTLREDIVYFVDLTNGIVGSLSKNVEVYRLNMRAEEVL